MILLFLGLNEITQQSVEQSAKQLTVLVKDIFNSSYFLMFYFYRFFFSVVSPDIHCTMSTLQVLVISLLIAASTAGGMVILFVIYNTVRVEY